MCVAANIGLASFSSIAVAQAPTPTSALANPRPEPVVVPIHTAIEQDGVPYGVWAAGSNYKVSFHDGATFVPLLGGDYPVNQPLHWRTASATIGGAELATAPPRLTYTDRRAEYDLGGIVEAYDIRPGGVEQTFVIANRVSIGDLTIRGHITTSLLTDPMQPTHGGLSFVDAEGRELITYGAATAIDANGKQFAMTTSYTEGVITLQLPGTWLAQAAYPIVVDPMLGSGGWVSDVDPIGDIDVVRPSEGTGDQVWVSYSRYASANDGDVYLQRFGDDGTPAMLAFQSISGLASSDRPSCAYNALSNRVVMVYDEWTAFGNNRRRLRVHWHDRSDPSMNTNSALLGAPDNAWKADVGGTELGGDGNHVCVVWQQESQTSTFQDTTTSRVYGFLFHAVSGVSTPPKILCSALLTDCHDPCVSTVSSSGNDNRWAVAWQSYNSLPSFPTWDISARLFYESDVVSPAATIYSSSSRHEMGPKIAGGGNRWMLACTTRPQGLIPTKPTTSDGTDLRVVRLEWPALANAPTLPHGFKTVHSQATTAVVLGSLDYHRQTDSHWGMSWHNSATGAARFETVGYRGESLQSEHVASPPGGGSCAGTAVTYNSTNGQFVIAYGMNFASLNFVQTNRFEFPGVASWYSSGTSCSPATITWLGHQFIGGETGKVRVAGAAPDSLQLLALSLAYFSAPLSIAPFTPACRLNLGINAPDFLGLFPVQVGSVAEFALPLPEPLSTTTLFFQGVHTVGNNNLDMVTTRRLVVPIVK